MTSNKSKLLLLGCLATLIGSGCRSGSAHVAAKTGGSGVLQADIKSVNSDWYRVTIKNMDGKPIAFLKPDCFASDLPIGIHAEFRTAPRPPSGPSSADSLLLTNSRAGGTRWYGEHLSSHGMIQSEWPRITLGGGESYSFTFSSQTLLAGAERGILGFSDDCIVRIVVTVIRDSDAKNFAIGFKEMSFKSWQAEGKGS